MKYCSKCGAANDDANSICTVCGAHFTKPGKKTSAGNQSKETGGSISGRSHNKARAIIIAIILICIVVAALTVIIPLIRTGRINREITSAAPTTITSTQAPKVFKPDVTPLPNPVLDTETKEENKNDENGSADGTDSAENNDGYMSQPDALEMKTVSFQEYSGSMSRFHSIRTSSATASSEIHFNGKVYSATNAIDGDLITSWQESADGDGIGEYLIVHYDQTKCVDLIRLRLGSSSYYKENGRPKMLSFEFSDGTQSQYSFPDINKDFYLQPSCSIETEYIKITILDVYPGERWNDTSISEVTAYQKTG